MPDLVGKTLANRYHLLTKLGEGSMASVYRARDRVRGCSVAVKVLKVHHLDDPATFKRFRREAESLARLEHPHIVRFYELVTKAEAPFLVMDYIEGQDVTQLLDTREGEPLPLARALQILYQVGGALHFAHQRGILHRDIKPSNILLDRSSKAYLTDFGIALLSDRTRLTHDRTEPGIGPGTQVYMAPEQWLGEEPDARTDVYALGVLLYELLTGRPPFVSEDPEVLFYQHVHTPPEPPSHWNPEVPRGVEWVILKALAKKQDERYLDVATMLEVLRTAETAGEGRPTVLPGWLSRMRRVLRPPAVDMGTILVLLAVLAGLLWLRSWQWPWVRSSETAPVAVSLTGTTAPVPLTVTSIPTPTPTASPTEAPTWTPMPGPSYTPTPSSTPSPTPTTTSSPTATPLPYAVVKEEIDVYKGPGEVYGTWGQASKGSKLVVLGCSEDGEWIKVNYLGWEGWVRGTSVYLIGKPPIVKVAPTPTCVIPHIKDIHLSSDTVDTMSAITVTCELANPIGETLTYTWTASGGSITGEGDTVTYRSDVVGSYTITVTVHHKRCGRDERSTQVEVVPAQPLALIIDSFESYDNDAALNDVYNVNSPGVNTGDLSLASPPNVSSGNRGASFYYHIKDPNPKADYAGFDRTFDAQDWRGYSGLCVWIKREGGGMEMDLVIQFGEASGEVWRYRTDLSTFEAKDFCPLFNEDVFQWADWSAWENGRIDLDAVSYYGFFVGHGGSASGWIYVDDIRLIQ